MRPRISISGLVRLSVGPSVMLSSKSMKKGQGGRRGKEEVPMRWKEGRGGRRDKENEKNE